MDMKEYLIESVWRNWAVAGIPQFAMFPGASMEGKLATVSA